MAENSRFKTKIPNGQRIFVPAFEVAGASYRLEALSHWSSRGSIPLVLEVDPNNPHDKNAIKVIALRKRFLFGVSEDHVGFIPKKLAKLIVDLNLESKLRPRAKSLWIGDRGGASLVIDLLGDKSLYSSFSDEEISKIKNWE